MNRPNGIMITWAAVAYFFKSVYLGKYSVDRGYINIKGVTNIKQINKEINAYISDFIYLLCFPKTLADVNGILDE